MNLEKRMKLKEIETVKHWFKPCLKCSRIFKSIGNYNRICESCNEENRKVSVLESCPSAQKLTGYYQAGSFRDSRSYRDC